MDGAAVTDAPSTSDRSRLRQQRYRSRQIKAGLRRVSYWIPNEIADEVAQLVDAAVSRHFQPSARPVQVPKVRAQAADPLAPIVADLGSWMESRDPIKSRRSARRVMRAHIKKLFSRYGIASRFEAEWETVLRRTFGSRR